MRRALWLFLLLPLLLGACGDTPAATPLPTPTTTGVAPPPSTNAAPLLILAAADLQFALPEITAQYEQATGAAVTISTGSTGNFASQIENGAPGDLFFAADQSFIARLSDQGLVLSDTRQLYATGRIVLVAATSAPVPVQTLDDLRRPELKKIAIANPEHAPYGRAARSALQATDLWDALQPKLVLGENIAQTFQFVQTGNADAGIVALSIVLGYPGTPYTLIDAALHPPLNQEAAVLTRSPNPAGARAFLAFVNGPQGRPIMKKYGFTLPGETP